MKVQVAAIVLATWSAVLADFRIAQSRLFFPVLSAFHSNGYPKSYPAASNPSYYPAARPSKGQYPAARPPSSSYGAPKPPSSSYGAPKPPYPASSYPAPSSSYPAPKPSYGAPKPISTTYKPATGYYPGTTRAPVYFTTETPATYPSYPSYPSYPKPGHQPQEQQWTPGPVFVFIPKPQHPSASYPAASPSYLPPPKASYSVAQSSYPAPNAGYAKPSYPAPGPSYPKPSYPAPVPSYQKPTYPAPESSYPKPSNAVPSYPDAKPPAYSQPQAPNPPVQYPAPVRPSPSYGPPKPVEPEQYPPYEVPRPIVPPTGYIYRLGSTQSPSGYEQPLTAPSGHNASGSPLPSFVVGVLPDYRSTTVHPQVFQRGNAQHPQIRTPGPNPAATTEGSQVHSTLFRQQVDPVTPRSVLWSPDSSHNDCGGPWVILGDHAPETYSPDPSQIEITPAEELPLQRARDQSGRVPSGKEAQAVGPLNELTWPPVFFLNDPKPVKSEETPADQFFFLVSPTTTVSSGGGGGGGGGGGVSSTTSEGVREGSTVAFNALPILPASSIGSASNRSIISGSLLIDSVNEANTPTIKVLSSTENTIIFSRNRHPDGEKQGGPVDGPHLLDVIGTGADDPSPFLTTLSPDFDVQDLPSSISQVAGDDESGRSVHLAESEPAAAADNSLPSAEWEAGNYSSAVADWLARANLKALAHWMQLAQVASLLQPDQEYTLMAPSNVAFSQVSSKDRRHWRHRQDQLRQTLLYHIVPGRLSAAFLVNEGRPPTLAGSQQRLRINVYNGTDHQRTLTVDGARILTPDLQVEPSGMLTVHVIDLVLSPVPQHTILDILEQGGLHSAILGPTLSSTLASASALTVFVPTTEAFLQIGPDDQLALLHNDTAFHRLLWYHVVPGTYYSQGMEDGQLLTSLRGIGKLKLRVERLGPRKSLLQVNGARVVRSDVSATNGVIHFIDRILTDILL